MKKTAYTMIALVVLVGSMAMAAQAQNNGRRLVATIPFQFSVGDKALPAGEYIITQTNPSSDHAVLQVRSKDGRSHTPAEFTSVLNQTV